MAEEPVDKVMTADEDPITVKDLREFLDGLPDDAQVLYDRDGITGQISRVEYGRIWPYAASKYNSFPAAPYIYLEGW